MAKLLQNLANKPTYAKEHYMITLSPFIEQNKPRFNQFLNNLCEVTDFKEALEVISIGIYGQELNLFQMEQYIALSKKEIELNITLNEIYSTHSLLLQHQDTLVRF